MLTKRKQKTVVAKSGRKFNWRLRARGGNTRGRRPKTKVPISISEQEGAAS